jgi:hypothetical protein
MGRRAIRMLLAVALTALAVGAPLPAAAAPAPSGYPIELDPGYLISDAVFYDSTALSEREIQDFLDERMSLCAPVRGETCLRDYVQSTPGMPATDRCDRYRGGLSESASRILHRVAVACGINPQVLLVTLQKENSLITAGSPEAGAYRTAMGYGCPDSAACDAAYFGFFNQVYRAAAQFVRYGLDPESWRYHPGTVSIQFHPNPACGATDVTIRNQASANLYNYTPYQPNEAALLARHGDVCSSYGNRNFSKLFTDWFGSPT